MPTYTDPRLSTMYDLARDAAYAERKLKVLNRREYRKSVDAEAPRQKLTHLYETAMERGKTLGPVLVDAYGLTDMAKLLNRAAREGQKAAREELRADGLMR